MKLSVIIPIYNVEDALLRCVDSVLKQDLGDYEVLLIDDGSTDNSGKMADDVAAAYEKITVYHKENGGLSDARNFGIDHSSGEYITFIDSDDEVSPHSLSLLMEAIEQHLDCDILEYPVLMNPGCKNEFLFKPKTNVYSNCYDWLAEYGLEHCWAWNKIYKRKLFETIRFPIGKVYEDIYLVEELLKVNPRIMTTDKGLYLYHWNKDGIANRQMTDGLTSLLEAQIHLVKALNIDTTEKRWHRVYLNMFTSQLHSYRRTGHLTLWHQRIAIRKYVRFSDYVKAILLDLLGLKVSCKLFKLVYRR